MSPAGPPLTLYGYFRSSAAYRVRIALNLKGLHPEQAFIHLRRGEQHEDAYRAINPDGLLPALEHDGRVLTQSLAIIEYLDELQPRPPLLPAALHDRAHARAIALTIACEIHPLNNLRVLRYLKHDLELEQPQVDEWYAHWIAAGLSALELRVAGDTRTGTFCLGETPGLAEICLVPQIYNAERMKCDLTRYPVLCRIAAAARALPAFQAAAPDRQPDAE
jgi:maleylpyruvate isomerase